MSYSITTQYDSRIPSWPGNGTKKALIACHDTEGGQGRVGALGTIQFLIDNPQRGASYHELWWYHETTDDFGVIRIVRPDRAAGSIAPQRDKYFPTTWVKTNLGVNAWDPNQGVYAISIAGRVADVERYSRNPKFLAHAHRRMMELWKELNLTKRAEHFQFNPSTRSDWGRSLMPALGGPVTSDRWQTPVEENPMNPIMPIKPARLTLRPGTSIRLRPDLTAESKPWTISNEATVVGIATVKGVDFGSGPDWYAYVINTGGLRFFHSQDIVRGVTLVDPASVQTDCSVEVASAVSPLKATIEQQSDRIASLMTEAADLEAARLAAEKAAQDAIATAGDAVALKAALKTFLG